MLHYQWQIMKTIEGELRWRRRRNMRCNYNNKWRKSRTTDKALEETAVANKFRDKILGWWIKWTMDKEYLIINRIQFLMLRLWDKIKWVIWWVDSHRQSSNHSCNHPNTMPSMVSNNLYHLITTLGKALTCLNNQLASTKYLFKFLLNIQIKWCIKFNRPLPKLIFRNENRKSTEENLSSKLNSRKNRRSNERMNRSSMKKNKRENLLWWVVNRLVELHSFHSKHTCSSNK